MEPPVIQIIDRNSPMTTVSQSQQYSILSQNVLANIYCTRSFWTNVYSSYCEEEYLEWSYRRALLRKQLFKSDADVICLQELEIDHVQEDFVDYFEKLGYGFVLQESTSKAESCKTCCGMFYKKNLFKVDYTDHRSRAMIVALRIRGDEDGEEEEKKKEEIVEEKKKEEVVEEVEVKVVKEDDKETKTPKKKSKNKKQQLSPKKRMTGEHIWICNVHLEGAPELCQVRFQQIKSMLKNLRRQQLLSSFTPSECATVICGDFNCGKTSGVYKCLVEGKLPSNYTECRNGEELPINGPKAYSHDYSFKSANNTALGYEAATIAVKGMISGVLDFIFYTSPRLDLVSVLSPAEEDDLSTFFPSVKYPSDHCAVGAVLSFVQKQKQ